jgi:glycosyltransferase involved in cell wall biosynthesis
MKKLSIGIAHHNDFSGAWFTIQDIRKELIFNKRKDLLEKIEFVIVENDFDSEHAEALKEFGIKNLAKNKSLSYSICRTEGTSISRNTIIDNANGEFVLVLDCHVLLCPALQIIDKLINFIDNNPDDDNIYCGPLVGDDGESIYTHFTNEWSGTNLGRWSLAWQCECEDYYFELTKDQEIKDLITGEIQEKCPKCALKYSNKNKYKPCGHMETPPFEIGSQGLGCFFVRKKSWLGFNKHSRGFGAEEFYIHEKYRKNGRKAYCLPFLKWMHRFGRPDGPKYQLEISHVIRNYILEFIELGLDLSPVYDYFVKENEFDEIVYNSFVREAKYLYNKE